MDEVKLKQEINSLTLHVLKQEFLREVFMQLSSPSKVDHASIEQDASSISLDRFVLLKDVYVEDTKTNRRVLESQLFTSNETNLIALFSIKSGLPEFRYQGKVLTVQNKTHQVSQNHKL